MAKINLAVNGLPLINDFQNTQIMLATIEGADYQAKQSEEEILNQFSSYKHNDQAVVSPTDIPLANDDNLVKASLNAHLQKVQSEQIKNYGTHTIAEMEETSAKLYKGKKIRLTVIDDRYRPIQYSWVDQKTKRQEIGRSKAKNITGKIDEISLENNYIILKPLFIKKLINNSLIEYYVEIISPDALQPMVSLSFL